MIFWDSSAIVPLCVNEPSSATVKTILAGDPVAVVWWTTRTECISALARQLRQGGTLSGERQARDVLHMVLFALAITSTVYVVLDLEYPRAGFITLTSTDQAMLDLRELMK